MADGTEILEFLTDVMRGDESGSPHNMKAAELLGKRMGLFSESPPPPVPVIIDDIEARVQGSKPARVEVRESG